MEWRIASVDISRITEYAPWQRPLDESWVRKIVRNYDASKTNQLILSQRQNGSFACIDGNHTVEATRRAIGPNAVLNAKIFSGLSLPEEASLYVSYNRDQLSMKTGDLLKANYLTGDDQSVAYVNALNASGIKWSFSKSSSCFDGHGTAFSCFKAYGPEVFRKAIDIFCRTKDVNGYQVMYLGGLCHILAHYDADAGRLERVIRATPTDDLRRRAKQHTYGHTGISLSKAWAIAIAELYNKGLRKNRIGLYPERRDIP